MVNTGFSWLKSLAIAATLTVTLVSVSMAAVVASVDRANVELNESFTLKVTVDSAIDTIPDPSALEADFRIGATSQLSNTTIVNGQISRSRTWTYVLMALRDGDLLIPPVVVGSEQSNPLYITVAPQSNALPGEADIFVTSEVDFAESYVQAQVLYTVKVYRSVATRQPRLSEPGITGVEIIAEVAGEERSYESILNGKSYNVVERVYALFPQQSGELNIAPARFEARVLRDGRITGRKVFSSEPINIVVSPIPPPPAGFPDAAWLPAQHVELSEDWSRDPGSLPAGEPITRHIMVTAVGQLSTQIPVIEPDTPDGVKIYPDKPELRVVADGSGMRASRKDQYAMIGITPGEVVLPELQLPWWDVTRGEWQIASLPPTTISILPSANAMPVPVMPEEPVLAAEGPVTVVHSKFWRHASEGLAAVWLLTLIAWWWSRRPEKKSAEPQEPPLHKRQSRLLKNARRAAQEDDSSAVKSALLDWGRLEWPQGAPRSIGDLATRVTDPLSTELRNLCGANYGPHDANWDGAALSSAIRSISVVKEAQGQQIVDGLPPLMPKSSAYS
jgi:hypothetical protein